ncbi:hypothetical protein E8E11_011343 [Didymella keratinophila]|nr:hypothetical protein E8E11_011343 [Didymella keratinophila]
MLRKIGSLSEISSSTQTRPRSPFQSPLLRRIHTAPDPSKAGDTKEEARAARTDSTFATFEPLPEHDESHVGPYGVETPLHWDFVVKVTEVTVAVKIDAEKWSCTDPGHNDDGLEKGGVEPKKG